MAIMRTGSIVGAISGDVSGISFANPAGSSVVRKKRRSSPMRSEDNRKNQNQMMVVRNEWASLSDDDKTAWRSAALLRSSSNRLGVNRFLSGYQYFMQYNRNRLFLTGVTLSLPIGRSLVGVSGIPVITSSVSGGMDISFPDEIISPSLHFSIYGRNLFRDTSIKFTNQRKFVVFSSPTQPTNVTFSPEWSDKLGLPVEDQFIFTRVITTDDESFQPIAQYDTFTKTTA